MNVEVLRYKNSLSIRWPNEAGELWTVTKAFTLDTRAMVDAIISGPAPTHFPSAADGRRHEAILHYAVYLAQTMDDTFALPSDFDLVSIDDRPSFGGYPALIFPRDESDGRIYIRIDKEPNL